jgi:hypothetical protein
LDFAQQPVRMTVRNLRAWFGYSTWRKFTEAVDRDADMYELAAVLDVRLEISRFCRDTYKGRGYNAR